MKAKYWVYIVIFVIAFLWACFTLLSCKVLRQIDKKSSDSTAVHKSNTALTDTSVGGTTKKITTKEDYDWWKRTETYPTPAPGVTNVYPQTVVYEGGKGSKETNQIDSNWFKNQIALMQAQLDSSNAKNEAYSKDSETKTKGLGILFVVLIALAALILGGIFNKYIKIVKR